MDPTTRAVVEAAKKKQQQMALVTENGGVPSNKYPIDAPSPVLLATSMILAIISTGTCVSVDSRERERNVYPVSYKNLYSSKRLYFWCS